MDAVRVARGRGVIAALDTGDLEAALGWQAAVAAHCAMVKVGLEFFCACGPEGVRRLAAGGDVFLDLKLHDIPNTVRGAIGKLAGLGPALVTLHGSGGAAMVAAARDEVERAGAATRLLAVTVLTSFDEPALWETGVSGAIRDQVVRVARLAVGAGAHGIVCSAHEARAVRDALGDEVVIVVPGVRPAGADVDDQARVMTPAAAMAAGADYIVVGRPIFGSADARAAAAAIAAEIGC